MKHTGKSLLSMILLLAMLLSLLPGLPMKAEAGGMIPGELATVDAGQELTLEVQGGYSSYQVTNLTFETVGNTIATLEIYKPSGELVGSESICDDDYLNITYNWTRGYRFEIKVFYGQIVVKFNLANHTEDPICTYYEFGKKLDWLVKPTINEVYMKVGDTAVMAVSQVTEGYSARPNDYESSHFLVADVDEQTGVITAREPGTTTVYMQVLFWQTSTQYFYFWVPCTVHVIEDYTLDAYWNGYYAEPGEKYFNIVAYREDGYRDVGFNITVGDQTYSTGNRTNAVVPVPADYTDSVQITKDGYVPYEIKAEHLEVNNVIAMTPLSAEGPVIQAVWVRSAETGNRNAKYQTIQIVEGKDTEYEISCDIFWNGHGASTIYLQQGNMTLPLSGEGDTVALGQYFTADGGQVYLHALTDDGYVVSLPLLMNVAAEVTFMEMDFGESVSTTVDESISGLGGQTVEYNLLNTVPVKFTVGADGSVRGLIGLQFKGSTEGDFDLWDYQGEIRDIIKKMKVAKKDGDKDEVSRLKKKLNDQLAQQDAYIDNRKTGFAFSSDVSYMGYFDGTMDENGLNITEVGMLAVFNVSATNTKKFFIGQVPAEWKLTFSDKVELVVGGLTDGSDGRLSFRVPEFTNTISVTGAVKAHILDVLGATISLQGNFKFNYPHEADSFADGTWEVDANFKVIGNAGSLDLDLLKLDSIEGLKIWPETTLTASAVTDNLMPAAVGAVPGINIQDAVEKAQEEVLAFRTDISADSVPQFMRLADMDVLVWVEEMAGRAEEDKPCLYYAVRSHETDTWSEPAPVYDDGSPDFSPKLMMVGDDLYVVWQKTFGSLAGVTEAGDILSSMDIYAARFDTATGTFEAGELVHDPDDAMDLLPQLRSGNDGLEAVWVRVSGDPLEQDVSSAILRSVYSGEDGWVTRPVADIPGIPDSLALGEDGSISYTVNGRLYSLADGVTTAVTSEEVYARAAKFCQGTLYWLEDDCVTDGTVRIPASFTAGDFMLHASPNGSRKALVFYASNENGCQLFATYGQGDSWGEPVVVMDATDAWFSGLSGSYDNDGQLCVAVNRLRTFSSGNQVSYLRLVTVNPRQDLMLDNVDYLGVSLTEGGNLLATVFVTNMGNLPVNTATIQVLQGEEVLLTNAVQLGLLPGQSGSADVVIPVDLATLEGVTVTVLPFGGTDNDLTNNTAELKVNLGDISSEYLMLDTQPDGTVYLSAMLINRGMADMEGVEVVFTRGTPDGEVLGTLEPVDAAAGQVIPVDMELSGLSEGELVYMTARCDTEENYISNNTAFARVRPAIRETATVQSSGDFQGQVLELDQDYSFTTKYDDQTGDAEEFISTFTPEETGFYLVRLNGSNLHNSYYHFISCRVEEVDGGYADQKWMRDVSEDDSNGGWNGAKILSVYMEAGTAYAVNITGSENTVVTVRLEKAPAVTQMQTQDITMYLGEHLLWDHSDIDDFGLVTFLPELSRDLLSFSSSNEAAATVDESGYITTNGIGTAQITVTGQVYGLENSFTISVVEPVCGEPLALGENSVTVGEEEDQTIREFTAPETGYYRFVMAEESGFQLLFRDKWNYFSGSGALMLREGEICRFYFEWEDVLTIRKVDVQGEVRLGDDLSCEDDNCENVMLYRFVPEEDHLLHVWFRGADSALNIFDEDYELLYSESAGGSAWYSSGTLDAEMEAGKVYYIALEHSGEAYMSLSQVTMELDYYGAVFVGDTVELSPWFPDGGDEDAYTYTWSSSDSAVARVEQDGTVHFLKEGDVTITVTALEGLLKAEKSFYAIKSREIYLNREYQTTLDSQRIKAARLVFTPETAGDYVYNIRYQDPGDFYWMYEYELTDADGNYLETIHSEHIQGVGNNSSIHLEAGQTCVLTLYYEADSEEGAPIDLSFLVTLLDCETKGHTYVPGHGWEPGCDYTGMTPGEHCQVCGHVRVPQEEIPELGHDYVDGVCTRCGENESGEIVSEHEVLRLAGSHRWATALMVADEMKENLGVEKFDAIIVASGNDFADALAGSYLSTVKDAPILLSWGKGGKYEFLDTDNINYIKENLDEGGTVYILGGKTAVPELYEEKLGDYNVKRLGGAHRFETNLMILEEAGVEDGSEILVCTSTNFADSLSASATGKPILLVWNERGALYGEQPEFLADLENCTFTVIGGESAVSAKLADAIGAYGDVERLAGSNRFETSVLVAQKYFDAPESAVLAYAWNYPDGLCGGSLAYSMNAPLILTMTRYEAKAVEYATGEGIRDGVVLGGTGLISDGVVRAVFDMEEWDEIIVK